MDTSKEYIKMCDRAEEIQVLRIKELDQVHSLMYMYGDYFYRSLIEKWFIVEPNIPKANTMDSIEHRRVHLPGDIWLPRQDQLQDIHGDHYSHLNGVKHPYNFISWLLQGYKNKEQFDYTPYTSIKYMIDTWEKFWLVFVMYECYQKLWNVEASRWKQ